MEQQRQSNRLKGLLQKSIAERDTLATKKEHADKMHTKLLYTMHENTFQ